jgi:hypothetical protein
MELGYSAVVEHLPTVIKVLESLPQHGKKKKKKLCKIFYITKIKIHWCRAPVAHTYNPSYLRS